MKAVGELTYLVTGSTDGIGLHTATKLARTGATVLLHGRSRDKVDKLAAGLRDTTQNKKIDAYTYDLSSLKQVRSLAEAVARDHPRVDVLINNAGVFEDSKSLSEDGYEMTYAVNVLAPFLLTYLLKDCVTSKIINVSSISAASRMDFDNLNQEKGFSSHNAYSLSKLCMILFTLKLAGKVKESNVKVNCLDPGTVNTKMLEAGWGMCGIPVGSANHLWDLSTNPVWQNATGEYFVGGRPTRAPSVAYQAATQERLWHVLCQDTGVRW